jgi:hypothetical protein
MLPPPPAVPRIASISSKNRMQGATDRANEKARRIIPSASPTYDEAKTSAGDKEINAIPADPAAAFARLVLAQPGGPLQQRERRLKKRIHKKRFFIR